MTIRELLTLMTVIALISLLFFFWLSHLARGAEAVERGGDQHVRGLIQESLDAAFRGQVQLLFSSWMKDEHGQPARAAAGIRKSVAAYRHAIVAIDTQDLGLAVPLPRPREARR